jgi:5-methylcytosine-specific restriction endonuclease McrA
VITKTQLKQELVAERKKMRTKQKQSAFLRKTNNIYHAMKKRAEAEGKTVNFSLLQLRLFVAARLHNCFYCFGPISVANLAIDHLQAISKGGSFEIGNCAVVCKSCNWQKGGVMDATEFTEFRVAISSFRTEVQADIKRRLTIGGKWGVRV